MDTELTHAPILVLGTSERVGSNWLLDSVRHATIQHNEPLRQQISWQHPLSPLSSPTGPEVRSRLAHHWAEAFRQGKYHGGQHVIKETNLYFSARPFLELFPDASVIVLSRSPLGVTSSFTRGGLWERWGYGNIYRRVAAIAHEDPHLRWSALVPDDDPCPPVALTRLITVNAALLAEALSDRDHVHMSYEAAVLDRRSAIRPLVRLLPGIGLTTTKATKPASILDDTFTTTGHKGELVASLHPGTAALVEDETARALALLRDVMAPSAAEAVERWLGAARAYRRTTLVSGQGPAPAVTTVNPEHLTKEQTVSATYVPGSGEVTWRNLLITNSEMCEFLNELARAGFTASQSGVNLMTIPMPHERGGRLRQTSAGWAVSPGYDHHPVYWVTWLGAAAYALREGARLPAAAELDDLTTGGVMRNADYRFGDVTPVIEPGADARTVHHRVGNLQTWCVDGPDDHPASAPVTRYLHGAAWNTPGHRAEVTRRRSRHLLGASRGVGIRLARDTATSGPHTPAEIADRLNHWLALLEKQQRPLAELDQEAVRVLSIDRSWTWAPCRNPPQEIRPRPGERTSH